MKKRNFFYKESNASLFFNTFLKILLLFKQTYTLKYVIVLINFLKIYYFKVIGSFARRSINVHLQCKLILTLV